MLPDDKSADTTLPPTRLIDGKAFAQRLRHDLREQALALHAQAGVLPTLAVVMVGDDPASGVYVRSKIRATEQAGMRSVSHHLPGHTSEAELLGLIATLNANPLVHGILVQLPLPPQIRRDAVLDGIAPEKDVDGFHVVNAGRLAVGRRDGFIPCTPMGCLMLLKSVRPVLAGLQAVVIGCSNIVGRPMARLLQQEGCTVTMTHLRTRDVAAEARRADIIVVAAGRAGLVRGDWVKPGAIVIDVGINRVETPDGARIVGDVAFDEACPHAGAITPVPGGVGPMTIACLLQNTLQAARNTVSAP
ncbi:bifunctional methylenetetrahydrofolate dehydrogenase/methenyltetrahydrofolate cyclohydrolase FolD [Acetobacter sp. TBRC 12305]|uniref:Bifunctional protein FolD n=1 Tax=Acetobacter garciniae TaxID=2817435 RepID=A0A939KPZ8_9PROT|nr:bifunctional methylenetetrahydrofolate dehydrogenase/methenyltetrahydrofolate cyclohydrolase FolD [Acetobacter garciniae]MBO1324627.1 bifunctional methylenetetrahydrofolate dehydrogenase/methenyltetrahydrofolate cyclohydrolase FolD [Acetobacter garciniae]MBX0344316.1 bifunctional methylenetetrahydrofolate dehydrogenase/methenyltetrahydrofolate cyclohydrolase FolD [Acetobacter garciniae]